METKICGKCRKPKLSNEFNKNKSRKDGLQNCCKLCDRQRSTRYFTKNKSKLLPKLYEARRRRVIRNRNFVTTYLISRQCIDCNNNDLRVLDFDHVKGKKLYNISLIVHNGYSINLLKSEMKKCEIRCSNCHRIRTAKQFNYNGYLAEMD